MEAKEFFIKQQQEGKTENITSCPDPDYGLSFYQEIFGLMELYKDYENLRHKKIEEDWAAKLNIVQTR